MRKFLVITTINEPTEAIKKFAQVSGWEVVVVGDKKTPTDWQLDNVTYISGEHKESKFDLPWNNYVRKMYGYLYAIRNGADIIADTDDDNIPYADWGFPSDGNHTCLLGSGFENMYRFFTNEHVWPRGYPLQYVSKEISSMLHEGDNSVGVWQGLADKDPDVDAIYRMTGQEDRITFSKRPPLVLDKGLVCPFNSQNTMFKKELFPLLYLPVTVNQRFADILRGYVAQPIMWRAGFHLGFTQATVYQERNEHDLMKDFKDEIPCYIQSERAYEAVAEVVKYDTDVRANLLFAYGSLFEADIVEYEELEYLSDWLDAIGG